MKQLLTPHLEEEEVTRAWWAYWRPHGVEVGDMKWDVERAVDAYLETETPMT
jgi:hypothetical protein